MVKHLGVVLRSSFDTEVRNQLHVKIDMKPKTEHQNFRRRQGSCKCSCEYPISRISYHSVSYSLSQTLSLSLCSSDRNSNSTIKQSITRLSQQARHTLQTLNLFASPSSMNNPVDLHDQLLSTRLFICTLFLSTVILLVYVSAATVMETVTDNDPSLQQYIRLYSTRSTTLSCPCSKISINYAQFAHVQYTMHPLCNSVFVTDRFRDDFFPTMRNTETYLSTSDLRGLGLQTFQSLSIFCQMANRTITQGLDRLKANQYVTATVTSAQLFHSQTQDAFDQFLYSITKGLLSTLRTVRDINHANALLSGRLTNYDVREMFRGRHSEFDIIIPVSAEYSGCKCTHSPTCVEPGFIYSDWPSSQKLFAVPGLYIGCYTIEAVLNSTVECFYNETCFNQFLSHLLGNSSMHILPLDRSLLVRSSVQSTIQQLIDYLMVEKWNFSFSFEDYYQQCHPKQCSYTYVTRNDAIYIVTTSFSLLGGLSTVLLVLVPFCVKQARFLIRRYRRNVSRMISVA